MIISGRKVFFSSPLTADIVIFDECNEEFIREALPSHFTVAVFNQRPEDLWLGLSVIMQFLKLLSAITRSDIKSHPAGIFRGFLRQLKMVYFWACLLVMNPKAVVTFIDNSSTFGWLVQRCKNFPFVAIQNGGRLSYALADDPGISHQHLFCFGEHETKLLPDNGWNVEYFYPVGSLIASLKFTQQHQNKEIQYDLLVSSSWRGNIGFPQDVQDTMRSMMIMDNLLSAYIRLRGIRAAVVLRAERDSEHWYIPELGQTEEEYYQAAYGDDIQIIETHSHTRNIYSVIEQSKTVVACLTTVLLEAMGIGKKILFFNYTGTDLYHRDFHKDLVFVESDEKRFTEKMDALLAMPQSQYDAQIEALKKYYMNFDEKMPTYQVIASTLNSIIENHERIPG
jgi:surface carbohydrate biosynthesis protein